MPENAKNPPNRLRGAWNTFRRGRARPGPTEDGLTTGSLTPSPEDVANHLVEAEAEPYVSPGLKLAAAWSWRSIVVLVAIGVALWLLSKVSEVLLPVLIALLLAALLAPLTNWLVSKGFARGAATATSFFGLIIVVAGLLTLVGQQIYSGMPDLVNQVISGFSAISNWLAHNPFGIDSSTVSTYLDDLITTATNYLQNNSSELLGGAVAATSSVGSFLAGAAICLFATFFFLYDGRKIFTWVLHLLPVPAQEVSESAALRGWQTLVQYVRVQILVAGVDALGIGIGAAFLGIPLAIPLTVLVFLASFVPVVGAIASGVVAVLVALVSNGFVSAIIMLAVVIAVQQLEGHVLQPFLMGKAVSVHPLAVVLAVAAGGFLFSIVGALFAVPFVAVGNTVVTSIVRSNRTSTVGSAGSSEKDQILTRASSSKESVAEVAPDEGALAEAARGEVTATGPAGSRSSEPTVGPDDRARGEADETDDHRPSGA